MRAATKRKIGKSLWRNWRYLVLALVIYGWLIADQRNPLLLVIGSALVVVFALFFASTPCAAINKERRAGAVDLCGNNGSGLLGACHLTRSVSPDAAQVGEPEDDHEPAAGRYRGPTPRVEVLRSSSGVLGTGRPRFVLRGCYRFGPCRHTRSTNVSGQDTISGVGSTRPIRMFPTRYVSLCFGPRPLGPAAGSSLIAADSPSRRDCRRGG